jgi:hypothetical protein
MDSVKRRIAALGRNDVGTKADFRGFARHRTAELPLSGILSQGHHRPGKSGPAEVHPTEPIPARDPADHHPHGDMNVAIRDAFDAGRRQLEDVVRRTRN